jgi:hypothetical protein
MFTRFFKPAESGAASQAISLAKQVREGSRGEKHRNLRSLSNRSWILLGRCGDFLRTKPHPETTPPLQQWWAQCMLLSDDLMPDLPLTGIFPAPHRRALFTEARNK